MDDALERQLRTRLIAFARSDLFLSHLQWKHPTRLRLVLRCYSDFSLASLLQLPFSLPFSVLHLLGFGKHFNLTPEVIDRYRRTAEFGEIVRAGYIQDSQEIKSARRYAGTADVTSQVGAALGIDGIGKRTAQVPLDGHLISVRSTTAFPGAYFAFEPPPGDLVLQIPF